MQPPAADIYAQAEEARAVSQADHRYDSEAKKEAFMLYDKASAAFAEMSSLTAHESQLFDNCIYYAQQLSFDSRAPNFRADFRQSHQRVVEEEGKEEKASSKKNAEPEILPSVCALCRQRANLAEATSHILPEFLLRWAEEVKYATPQRKGLVSPSNLKRKLLCRQCEGALSEIEGYANRKFFQPFKKIYNEANATPSTITLEQRPENLPPSGAFYKFLVSLFWRQLAVLGNRDAWGPCQWRAFDAGRAILLGKSDGEAVPLYAFFANTQREANSDFDSLTYATFCAQLIFYYATMSERQMDFMFLAMRGCHVMLPLSDKAQQLASHGEARISQRTTSITIQPDGERFTPNYLRVAFKYQVQEQVHLQTSTAHFQGASAEELRKAVKGPLAQRLRRELGTNQVELPTPETGAKPVIFLPPEVYFCPDSKPRFQLKGGCPGCRLEEKSVAIQGLQLYHRTCSANRPHESVLCDLDVLRPRLVMACRLRLTDGELELTVGQRVPLHASLSGIPRDHEWLAIEAAIKELLCAKEEGKVEVV